MGDGNKRSPFKGVFHVSGSLYGNATNLGGTITGEGELLVTNGSSGSNNFTISSVISDKDASHQMSVKVNKNSSVVVFSGNNTYTGGTTIVQGTLQTNSATALGQGSVLVQGGTLNANSQALANAITLQTGTIQNLGSASAPKDLTVSLTGNAAINNSTVILGNASGAPMISTGQVLTLSGTTSATLNNATLNLSSFKPGAGRIGNGAVWFVGTKIDADAFSGSLGLGGESSEEGGCHKPRC